MTLQRIPALTILALTLAACAAPTPANIRPASDIFPAEPQFTDLKPESVTVEVETSQSVVCAVVYGATSDYGQPGGLGLQSQGTQNSVPLPAPRKATLTTRTTSTPWASSGS